MMVIPGSRVGVHTHLDFPGRIVSCTLFSAFLRKSPRLLESWFPLIKMGSWVMWHMSVVPAFRRLRQRDCWFNSSLGYIASSRPTWLTFGLHFKTLSPIKKQINHCDTTMTWEVSPFLCLMIVKQQKSQFVVKIKYSQVFRNSSLHQCRNRWSQVAEIIGLVI